MGKIRVLLADGNQLALAGIRRALDDDPEIEVVAQTSSGAGVLPAVRLHAPDIVLLDVRMPGLDGFSCLELITKNHPGVRVLMLAEAAATEQVEFALRRGARGYVIKSVNPLDLPATIRQAIDESVYFAMSSTGGDSGAGAIRLSTREQEILARVARGMSNREIGNDLWVTEQTVKFHLTNIYRKLGAANRTEAARQAFKLGLADSPLAEAI